MICRHLALRLASLDAIWDRLIKPGTIITNTSQFARQLHIFMNITELMTSLNLTPWYGCRLVLAWNWAVQLKLEKEMVVVLPTIPWFCAIIKTIGFYTHRITYRLIESFNPDSFFPCRGQWSIICLSFLQWSRSHQTQSGISQQDCTPRKLCTQMGMHRPSEISAIMHFQSDATKKLKLNRWSS